MSFVRILVHAVWTTKNRIPYLNDSIREEVIQHIRQYAITKGIYIDHINGEKEHIHALISLAKNQCIADVMQYLKGESSFWINKHKKTTSKFEWQDDYWAVSIGISQLEILREYIRNQVSHHRKSTFINEVDMMIKVYGLEKFSD
ncbi:MAG: IS200/IS605 family transposase [Methanosarcina sp.]